MFLVFKHCSQKLMFFLLLQNQVNRIKNETGTSILIPSNNEHSNILRIEGSPKGVASAKEEIMQMVKKLVSFCCLVVKSLNGVCSVVALAIVKMSLLLSMITRCGVVLRECCIVVKV